MQSLSNDSLWAHFAAIEEGMTDAGKAQSVHHYNLLRMLRDRAKRGGFRNQPIILHRP